jgi:hypothetical protein
MKSIIVALDIMAITSAIVQGCSGSDANGSIITDTDAARPIDATRPMDAGTDEKPDAEGGTGSGGGTEAGEEADVEEGSDAGSEHQPTDDCDSIHFESPYWLNDEEIEPGVTDSVYMGESDFEGGIADRKCDDELKLDITVSTGAFDTANVKLRVVNPWVDYVDLIVTYEGGARNALAFFESVLFKTADRPWGGSFMVQVYVESDEGQLCDLFSAIIFIGCD